MSLETVEQDASIDQVLTLIERDGACIVKDRWAPDKLAQFVSQTTKLVEDSDNGMDDFSGRLTRRTGALIAASKACQEIVLDELVVGAAREFLEPFCRRIQMMLTQIISIYPGEKAQPLHRDRLAWGGFLPSQIEPQLNTIWANTDFTLENGATQVVPGSHRWTEEREPLANEVTQAVMSRGSVLIYTGSVIRGGGANRSEAVRAGLNIDYCLDWLRQEENQYLSCPPDIARNLPQAVTDLIGYTAGGYTLGSYTDPSGDQARGVRQAEQAVGYLPPQDGLVQ